MKKINRLLYFLCGLLLYLPEISLTGTKELIAQLSGLNHSLGLLSTSIKKVTIVAPKKGTADEGTAAGLIAGTLAGSALGVPRNPIPEGENFTQVYINAYGVAYNPAFEGARKKAEQERDDKIEKKAKEALEQKLTKEPAKTWYAGIKLNPGLKARALALELFIYSLEKIAKMKSKPSPAEIATNFNLISSCVWVPKALLDTEVAIIKKRAKNFAVACEKITQMRLATHLQLNLPLELTVFITNHAPGKDDSGVDDVDDVDDEDFD